METQTTLPSKNCPNKEFWWAQTTQTSWNSTPNSHPHRWTMEPPEWPSYLYLIIVLKSPPKEKRPPHLHNIWCICSSVSSWHTCTLTSASTYSDKAPLSNSSTSPQIKGTCSPCLGVTALEVISPHPPGKSPSVLQIKGNFTTHPVQSLSVTHYGGNAW